MKTLPTNSLLYWLWNIISKRYYFLISIVLIGIIIRSINWLDIAQLLKNINYPILIIGMLLTIPYLFIRAWRWNYLKKRQGIIYKVTESFTIYIAAMGFASITPGRIAELIKIYYLKARGYKSGDALVSVIMDRLFDLFFLLLFSLTGLIFFFNRYLERFFLLYLLIGLSILTILVLIKNKFFRKLVEKIFYHLMPSGLSSEINNFKNGLRSYNYQTYIVGFLITIISWIIYSGQIYLFGLAINLTGVTFLELITSVAIASFLSLLPVSFLGIGTREATLIILLGPLVKSTESLILLSEIILFNFIIVSLCGAIMTILKPVPFNCQIALSKNKPTLTIKDNIFSYLTAKVNIKKLDDFSNWSPLSWLKKIFIQKMISMNFPQHIFLESTSSCNFNCKICARTTGKTIIGSMDFNLFKKIVDEANNYGPRTFSLHFSGEPMINPRLMEMAKYIKEKNPKNSISLTTNGSLMSPAISEQMVKIGIDKVSISFLSPEAKTYYEKTGVNKLDEVEKNILELIKIKRKALKPQIFVRMIVESDTESQTKDFVAKWKDKKVIIELKDQHNYGGNVEKSHIKKNHKRYPCYHLWFSPAVHFNGDVSICCDDLARQGVLGNANKQTINEIWNSDRIKKYRQLHLEGKYDQIPICSKCDVWNVYTDIFFSWQKNKSLKK